MSNKIAIIGTGYVGLVAAVGLADFGNTCIGVDIDAKKIENLKKGISPIYESGIEEYLQRNLKTDRLSFTTDIKKAIKECNVIFIGVGTPSKEDGDIDLSQLEDVVHLISVSINSYKVIVTKSTVPVGTNKWIKETIRKESGFHDFDIVSNPEFLREGRAVYDFFHPDRIVIGYETQRARECLEKIYRPLYLIQAPFVWCNIETAELIKYANNTFLATKITFINQLAMLADKIDADIHTVAMTMGMDGRISSKFLHPGPGYGGGCFPKDVNALIHIGEKAGVNLSLIREVAAANENHKKLIVDKFEELLDTFNGKTIAVMGLAFKAETDDTRESPASNIIAKISAAGAIIHAHDPKAIQNFKNNYSIPGVNYFNNEFDALTGADAMIICTEWNEYRNLDLGKARECMRGNIIYDTRNVIDGKYARNMGFIYKGLGRGGNRE